jgi:hypothetical protein
MKRRLSERRSNGPSDSFPIFHKDAGIAQYVKHRAALDALAGFPLRIERQSDKVLRNATNPRRTADIDFRRVAIVDDARNKLNHLGVSSLSSPTAPVGSVSKICADATGISFYG